MKPYIGDTGTAIILDCVEDVSAASAISIEVRKPDGTTDSWDAEAESDTEIRFDTEADTFDQPGLWKLQAKVTISGSVWLGETVDLVVYRPFR